MNINEYKAQIERTIEKGKYKDTWESLCKYESPLWYRDAKFGIFIHWGIYSVPAFGSEWYSRNMYKKGSSAYEHHITTYGTHKEFGYKDFIPMFRGEHFDAEEWMRLIAQSGAKYVVPVAEHHDGFQMYKSELSRWNSYEMGPKRDVLLELKKAAEKYGIKSCLSTHRLEHWFFMGNGRLFESDINDDVNREDIYWPSCNPDPDFNDVTGGLAPSDEFLDDWLIRTCELIDKYDPELIYFDWWIHHESVKPWLRKIAAYYYDRAIDRGKEVVINYKYDAFAFGSAVIDMERGQFSNVRPYVWQSCTSVAKNSWGYTHKNEYKDAKDLVCDLIDIVSKNGCMLLNIDPMADGTIPEPTRRILECIGAWLSVNGEAIFGSRPWRIYGEGDVKVADGQFSDCGRRSYTAGDIRYTVNNGAIYAMPLATSDNGEYKLKAFALCEDVDSVNAFLGIIRDIILLNTGEGVRFERNNECMRILTERYFDEMPPVFKIITE